MLMKQIIILLLILFSLLTVNQCKSKEEKLEALRTEINENILKSDLKAFEKNLNKLNSDFQANVIGNWIAFMLQSQKEDFIKKYLEIYKRTPNSLYEYVEDENQIKYVTKLGGNLQTALKEGFNPLSAILNRYNANASVLEAVYKSYPFLYTRYYTKAGTDRNSPEFLAACRQISGEGFNVFYSKNLISAKTILDASKGSCEDILYFLPYIGLDAKNEEGDFIFVKQGFGNLEFLNKLTEEQKEKIGSLEDKDGNNLVLMYLNASFGENRTMDLSPQYLEAILAITGNVLARNKKDKVILDFSYEMCNNGFNPSDPYCEARNILQGANASAVTKISEDAFVRVKNGDLTVIEELKSKKIKLDDVRASNGQTMLMECVIYNHIELATKLLEEHVNASASRGDGNTAMDLALAGGSSEMQALLKKWGAKSK